MELDQSTFSKIVRVSPVTVVLIGGSPRSGTTLLADIFNENEHAGIFVEYSFSQFLSDLLPIFSYGQSSNHQRAISSPDRGEMNNVFVEGGNEEGGRAGDIVRATAGNYNGINNLPRMRHQARYPKLEDLAQIAHAVVCTALAKKDLRIIGSKTPNLHDHVDVERVFKTFDKVKVVFMIRNPLAVVNSSLRRRNNTLIGSDDWHVVDAERAVHEYIENIVKMISLSKVWPECCFLIKYEDLIKEEHKVIDKLSDFLTEKVYSRNLSVLSQQQHIILTDKETRVVERAFGSVLQKWEGLLLTGRVNDIICNLHGCVYSIVLGEVISFRLSAEAEKRKYLGLGWSGVESEGVWSDCSEAHIIFDAASNQDCVIRLELTPFLPDGYLEMEITLNGHVLFKKSIMTQEFLLSGNFKLESEYMLIFQSPCIVKLDCTSLNSNAPNILAFKFPRLISGLDRGISKDPRRLGIQLRELSISPVHKA